MHDLLELTEAELVQSIAFALRQRRSLLNQNIKRWGDDSRPERLAASVVEQLRLSGIRVFRTRPGRGASAG